MMIRHSASPSHARAAAPRFLLAASLSLLALSSVRAQSVRPPMGARPDMLRVVVRDTLVHAPPIVREFRGVWVSPAADGDWPSRPGLSASAQRAELVRLLDRAKEFGLNAIIFHVRLSGDALYDTPLAPWSAKLSGVQGRDPGYDPLAFVIEEAHARGLQVHAWFNPFRASLDGGIRAASNHVSKAHPAWVRRYGRQLWIDPGIPAARESVLATIMDVVRRYDVDGVHLDDFFYPYRETETLYRRVGRGKKRHTVKTVRERPFPDATSWARYGRGKWKSRDDWRRNNIDVFIKTMYERVHEAKPWVSVGISPFGIWRPGSPAGVDGLDSYREVYADSRKWLREGWVDYLAPQLYWPIDGIQNRFRALDAWWRTQNPLGRHVWPGLYTAGAVGRAPWPSDEIARQIATLRLTREGTLEENGHIHFRIGSLTSPIPSEAARLATPLGEQLGSETYRLPALVPEMPWLGGAPPAAPLAAVAGIGDDEGPTLLLGSGDSTVVSLWVVQTRTPDGKWSMAVLPASTRQLPLGDGHALPDVVVVTSVDRIGQQSPQTIIRVRKPSS